MQRRPQAMSGWVISPSNAFIIRRTFIYGFTDTDKPLVNRWKEVWPIRASEAPVRARSAAFRGWNPTLDANHSLKTNAGGKLSILSHRYIFMLAFNRENGRDQSIEIITFKTIEQTKPQSLFSDLMTPLKPLPTTQTIRGSCSWSSSPQLTQRRTTAWWSSSTSSGQVPGWSNELQEVVWSSRTWIRTHENAELKAGVEGLKFKQTK